MTRSRYNFLILGAIILSLVSAGVSMTLTANFTYDLGAKIGLASIFLIIGIVLDLTKHISPLLVLNHLKEKQLGASAIITSFFVVLTIVSIVASADALSSSLNEKNSLIESSIKQNAALSTQIAALKETKANLVALAKNQEQLNQITAMSKTSKQMIDVDAQLIKLINQDAADKLRRSKEATTALPSHEFSNVAIYSFATVIELISILMSVSAYMLLTSSKESKSDKTGSEEKIDLQKMMSLFGEMRLKNSEEKVDLRDNVTDENEEQLAPVVNISDTAHITTHNCDHVENTRKIDQHKLSKITQAVDQAQPEEDDGLLLKFQHNDTKIEQDTIEIKAARPQDKKPTVYKILDDGSLRESTIDEIKSEIISKQVEPKFRNIDAAFTCSRTIKNQVFDELINDGVLMKVHGKRSLIFTSEYA
ncbi:hypothetical protein [Photobacterium damselae]|uniref:hypothetical protein n=1 Tax=Photobacterium damselae TaxID=38293 RepID=UPI001F181EA7|nr:hypothetical protein [Photobacterium damselae]UKA04538.1 hypothetical protein IHC89_23230 [Photobacterium damselae subsp. damselae]